MVPRQPPPHWRLAGSLSPDAFQLSIQGVTGTIQAIAYRSGYVGSFFTGVLATLVATPCTAPFMGAAVEFALSQSVEVVFGIFTTLAIGFALPYLLISYIPAIGRRLPRPGRWMETFKQLMAFLVFGTVIWLAWVLGFRPHQQGWSRCSWRSSLLASRCGSLTGRGERRRSPPW
jgi:thiol:disulfide interchange protein